MRASGVLLRSNGFGWYHKYLKEGAAGFQKYPHPAGFDWSKILEHPTCKVAITKRPKAFFDISVGEETSGRLTFELAEDVVPKTVENFKLLCTGQNIHSKSYKGTKLHRVVKGQCIMAGDLEFYDGTGSHSAYEKRYIPDENFIIPHTERGLLRLDPFKCICFSTNQHKILTCGKLSQYGIRG